MEYQDRRRAQEAGSSRCEACGAIFRCGAAAGDEGCWCAALPRVPVVDGVAGCFCPDCLAARVAEQALKPPGH
ncbi:MAG: cysteine-rich CWC family protein [Rhodocyclaceae bacterium]|nr:cysteine-rich CWC family protein [Rhodocyclaceae bacterium]